MAKIDRIQYDLKDLTELDPKDAPSLDLPAFVIERYFEKDGEPYALYLANVKRAWRPADGCPVCHTNDHIVLTGFGNYPRVIRDLPKYNKTVQIAFQSPRMWCKKCNQRFTPQAIDGLAEKGRYMTQRLLDYIKIECFTDTHTRVSKATGVSIETVQNIMDDEIAKLDAIRAKHPIPAPYALGIDEKYTIKKQKIPHGIIVDSENGNLIDMTKTNDRASFEKVIKSLDGWDTNIKVITIDMNNSYTSWLPSLFPNDVKIVVDKFHVYKNVNEKITETVKALTAFRRAENEKETDPKLKNELNEILKIVIRNKRLFNYSMDRITMSSSKSKKLFTVIGAFPEFQLLKELSHYLELLYDAGNAKDAETIWDKWQDALPPTSEKDYKDWCIKNGVSKECFKEFQSLRKSSTQFKKYILNYFEPGCRFTNAAAEGQNSQIDRIFQAGVGYKFPHLRGKAVYGRIVEDSNVYTVKGNSIGKWKPTTFFGTTGSIGQILNQDYPDTGLPVLNLINDSELIERMFAKETEEEIQIFECSPRNSDFPEEEGLPNRSLKEFLKNQ